MDIDKYYLPTVEELFVGYECLYFEPHSPNQWEPYKWEDSDIAEKIENESYIKANFRTPYLTKEQIEAEGFELIDDKSVVLAFKRDNLVIYFHTTTNSENEFKNQVDMKRISDTDKFGSTIFKGKIKSINEFRKILSYL